MLNFPAVGVCYGGLGNNLPNAQEVVNLYKQQGIKRMRLFDANKWALEALRGSNIELILGVGNSELPSMANAGNAEKWVQENVKKYYPSVKIRYIAVGNEVNPKGNAADKAQYSLPALTNIYNAVRNAGLQDKIKVSVVIDMQLLGNTYPPSAGAFRDDVRSYIDPIIGHLAWAKTPLLANVYPYFSYLYNQKDISLPYALFTQSGSSTTDQGRAYQNLWDAQMDALYSALERAGQGGIDVVVSETGWPSAGGAGTSVENAKTYLTKLIDHVQKGTPKRPKAIETYIFAMFDENQKQGPEIEKHWGLFSPNKQAKYGGLKF